MTQLSPVVPPSPAELPPLSYHPVAIFDQRYIDDRGIPDMHRTRQRIRAVEPVSNIFQWSDTKRVHVEVLEGGQASGVYEAAPGLYAVDIRLNRPLRPGEETMLEHITHFRYDKRPDPSFRRAIGGHVLESLETEVIFDTSYQPLAVWDTTWAAYNPDSPVLAKRQLELKPHPDDPQDTLGVYVERTNLQDTVVGLQWEWPE